MSIDNPVLTFSSIDYDVLLTNPPFSGEHKQSLLNYLQECQKPFLLLLPIYVATKSYWKAFIQGRSPLTQHNGVNSPHASSTSSSQSQPNTREHDRAVHVDVFYLLSSISYQYSHPEGTGKDNPPFFSAWFVGMCADPSDSQSHYSSPVDIPR